MIQITRSRKTFVPYEQSRKLELIMAEVLLASTTPVDTDKLTDEVIKKSGFTSDKRSLVNSIGEIKSSWKASEKISYIKPGKKVVLSGNGRKLFLYWREKRVQNLQRKEVKQKLLRPWDFVKPSTIINKYEMSDLLNRQGYLEQEIQHEMKEAVRELKLKREYKKAFLNEESLQYCEYIDGINRLGGFVNLIFRKLEFALAECCEQVGRYHKIKAEDFRGVGYSNYRKYLLNVCYFEEPEKHSNKIELLRLLRNFYSHNPYGYVKKSELQNEKNKKLLKLVKSEPLIVMLSAWSPYGEGVFYIWPKLKYLEQCVDLIENYFYELTSKPKNPNPLAPYYFDEDTLDKEFWSSWSVD